MNFAALNRILESSKKKTDAVLIPDELFRSILASAIKGKGLFDEQFYLEQYPDIAAAVKAKKVQSALDHYVTTGYFENRKPFRIIVDERYYLQENPDVAEAVKRGAVRSAQEHFDNAGFNEGRSPYPNFSLF